MYVCEYVGLCVCAGVGSVTAWPLFKSITFLDFCVCMFVSMWACVFVQERAQSLHGQCALIEKHKFP